MELAEVFLVPDGSGAKNGRASHDAHLSDDETVAKMGHPDFCGEVWLYEQSPSHPSQKREGWGTRLMLEFVLSYRPRRLLAHNRDTRSCYGYEHAGSGE
jgi:hypothetical protein